MVLYEYPVAKKLSLLLKQEYKKFKNIDWLHLSRAGIDECLPYLKNYKFVFTSGKKIQGPNVSEHCMSILLCLTRGIISFIDVDFTKKKMNKFRPTEILDKKILILGLGGIGMQIAKKIYSFGGKVYSIDYKDAKSKFVIKNYKLNDLSKVVKKFDIVINALPYTMMTKNLFDKKIFKVMKDGVFFVSVSRDQIINLKDLHQFLNKGKFGGVGIDNTGSIKMKKKIFFNPNKNLLITDHLAGITTNLDRREKLLEKNIFLYYNRKKLINVINTKRQY